MVVVDSTGRTWNFYPTISVQGNGQEPEKSVINMELKLNSYTGTEPVDMAKLTAKCVDFVRTL